MSSVLDCFSTPFAPWRLGARSFGSHNQQVSASIPLGRLSRTVLAEAVKNDLVIGHFKSRRSEFFDPIDAFLEIKDRLAALAVKMMMMALIRKLVARRLTWNLNTANSTLGLKILK